MKYSVLQSEDALPIENNADDYARHHKQSAVSEASALDWFRCISAFKMSAATFDTIFLSIERFNVLQNRLSPSHLLSLCFRSGRALLRLSFVILKRRMKESVRGTQNTQKPAEASRVYGGVLYFNPLIRLCS